MYQCSLRKCACRPLIYHLRKVNTVLNRGILEISVRGALTISPKANFLDDLSHVF